ncbi:MAG: Crp/Fnr family transcriptional regulator [Micromonosporaceae bacterium]|nr:Crp/Fnr family transcriptional regulator [Micromonosporaceae bacterium]
MYQSRDRVGPFWATLSPGDREELRRIGRTRFFPADSTIVHQNERSDAVFVVQTGCVKVVSVTRDGYRTVLALRDEGELLGELASMDGGPRSATVYALTDVTALVVPAARFAAFRRSRPVVDQAVSRILSSRLRESDRSLATVGAASVPQRLASTLLRLGNRYGTPEEDGVRIGLPLSQDDLAGLAFTSRRTIGRILAEWRGSGWISTRRRSVLLRNIAALNDLQSS